MAFAARLRRDRVTDHGYIGGGDTEKNDVGECIAELTEEDNGADPKSVMQAGEVPVRSLPKVAARAI